MHVLFKNVSFEIPEFSLEKTKVKSRFKCKIAITVFLFHID